jgi:hypothetical protein
MRAGENFTTKESFGAIQFQRSRSEPVARAPQGARLRPLAGGGTGATPVIFPSRQAGRLALVVVISSQ